MARTMQEPGATAAEADCSLLQRFLDLIEVKSRAGLPIGHYAAVLRVSESRLTAQCRRVARQSPQRLISAYLVRKAKAQILETTLSTSQIAFSLGFHDPAYFSRFFRQQTGQTPTQFRLTSHAAGRPAAPAATRCADGVDGEAAV